MYRPRTRRRRWLAGLTAGTLAATGLAAAAPGGWAAVTS